jgi:hypothetical protein
MWDVVYILIGVANRPLLHAARCSSSRSNVTLPARLVCAPVVAGTFERRHSLHADRRAWPAFNTALTLCSDAVLLQIVSTHLPDDTRDFIQRWQSKGRQYTLDKLEDWFDRFFTAYVLYNFLYEFIDDQQEYGIKADRKASAQVARKFLGAQTLFDDNVIHRQSETLVELIESHAFYIRDTVWDAERVKGLKTTDPEQWSESLLGVVYQIRCNTFHGQKRFEPEQRQILKPCIQILERLNEKLIEKLSAIWCQ